MSFKKNGNIFTVFTQNGYVNIKFSKEGKPIRLIDLSHLTDTMKMDTIAINNNKNSKRKLNNSVESNEKSPP